LKAALIASAENGVQKNVIGFQRGVGFQFTAPPAIFMLPGKQKFPRRLNRASEPRSQASNLSKANRSRMR
jgi:hypothetical protein